MKISRLDVLKFITYPFRSLFGSGIGNVRAFAFIFKWLIYLTIPRQHIVVEYSGCKMGMDIGRSRGFDALASGLIMGRGYEIHTTELFKRMVKPDMVVVDVGAHIGYYTLIASKLVGERGKVFAFEPEPRNYNNLTQNVELNNCKNVMTFGKAVSKNEGKTLFYVSDNASGECSLVEMKNRPKKTIEVETVILDNVLADQKVDIMKVDVDGSEMFVLLGAERLVGGNNKIKIFTEFWKPGLESAGYSCEEYWNKLVQCGFRFNYLIDEKKGLVWRTNLSEVLAYVSKADGVNLLCSKEEVSI